MADEKNQPTVIIPPIGSISRGSLSVNPAAKLSPATRQALEQLMQQLQKEEALAVDGGSCENYVECKKYNK